MKKLFFLSALLCASVMMFATDWSAIEWLGNGAGGDYAEKYKMTSVEGQTVVNIQHPGFAEEDGIYTFFEGTPLKACSLPEGKFAIQGAGIVLYLSAFTAKETPVTVTNESDVTFSFEVFFVDGTATAVENVAAPAKTIKVVEDGQLVIIKDGVRFNAAGQQIQ